MPQGLGNEHSVKGIAVNSRQSTGTFGINNANSKRLESLAGNISGDVCSYDSGFGEFADSMFSGDFPRGSSANDDFV